MKPNSKKDIPQANRLFTDREEQRSVFWNAYNELKSNLDTINDIKVITYYGVGGIGKSKLLGKLITEMKEKVKNPQYIYIDFNINNDPRAVLKSMRNKLQNDYNFEFPFFDLALYVYLKKVGEDVDIGEVKSLSAKSPILNALLDLGGAIPFVGLYSTVLKVVDNLVADTRNYMNSRKTELYELQNEEPNVILNNLPYYFAGDLENNLKGSKEPFVVFFDTYEVLVNELISVGEPLKNDEWIRDEKRGLITNVSNVLWVIAGREKIKWEQFNTEWKDSLDQHLLGDLSQNDAEQFLYNAGISDKDLIKEIYILTNGTPVYLDLCVDRFYEILEKDDVPTIDKIGKNINEVIERFVRYMDDSKKDLIYMLSCIDEWNEDLLLELSKNIIYGISYSAIEKIKGYSFISTEDDINYVMHQTIKEVLNKACPKMISDRTYEQMELYLYSELCKINSTNSEYLTLLKRYINYKLILINSAEDFKDFYNSVYLSFYDELKNSFQFKELSNIHSIIADFSCEKFGYSLETAKVNVDYSIALEKSGKYREALNICETAYESYKKLVGEEHEDIVHVMNILSKITVTTGNYNEALNISEKALSIGSRLLGQAHPETIEALHLLSKVYNKLGKYEKSLELTTEVLSIREQLLGQEHQDTLSAMSNLAVLYRLLGKYEMSLELTNKVLNISQKTLGEEHLTTISEMNNLSLLYKEIGKYNEALEITIKILDLVQRILGEEHPSTIRLMNNLSNNYIVIGKNEEALKITTKVLNLMQSILGEEHPDTISVMNNLSNIYNKIGKNEEALELSEKVFYLRQRILGEEHPKTLSSMNNLVVIYKNIGKYEEALELAKKVLELRKKVLGENHPFTIRAMNNLSKINSMFDKNEKTLRIKKKVSWN